MSIRSDRWIRRMAREHGMIDPFEDAQVRTGTISYGVSSYGYDMRVADEFKIFTNVNNAIVDPKAFSDKSFEGLKHTDVQLRQNQYKVALYPSGDWLEGEQKKDTPAGFDTSYDPAWEPWLRGLAARATPALADAPLTGEPGFTSCLSRCQN